MTTKEVSILELDPTVKPLFNEICWEADWINLGHLWMEFGKPKVLVLREPREENSSDEYLQRLANRRPTIVCGEWKLWIHVAYWRIVRSGKVLATGTTSSYKKKFAAMADLRGQQLVGIYISDATGATRFEFDLDTVLEVRRIERCSTDELWLLDGIDRYQRSVRGDGVFMRKQLEASSTERYKNTSAFSSDALIVLRQQQELKKRDGMN